MKQHIRKILVDGWWYRCYEHNGIIYLINRVGRSGDCLRF